MNFDITEDQHEYIAAAKKFSGKELTPNTSRWDKEEYFPLEVIKKSGELGFCGMYAPQQWGGMNLSRLDTSLILEELAYGCVSTAAFISIHNMTTWMLCKWGSEPLRKQWAQQLTQGDKLCAYCLTESDAGSDAASLRTKATKINGNYIINGSKAFISGAGATELLIVMCKTGEIQEGAKAISAIAVPAESEGIVFGKKEEKMGWRSQPTRSITFDNVTVPASHLLGAEGEGFKMAMQGLDGGRVNIASCSLGAAQRAVDLTRQYMSERKQFNKTLDEFQALQFKLADMETELVAAKQMVRLAAFHLDKNSPEKTRYCAMAKRFATDASFTICNQAMQLHGGYGYLKDYPIEQLCRDVRVHQILEGTNEIMRLIIARYPTA